MLRFQIFRPTRGTWFLECLNVKNVHEPIAETKQFLTNSKWEWNSNQYVYY